MRYNVSIIGAGTSGLIAARELGKQGISTIAYDQKKVLGHPVRASGIVSIRGLGSIGIDYSNAITNTLYGARIHAGKSTMHVNSKTPMAHVLERQLLNQICKEQAEDSGAVVSTGKRITAIDLDDIRSDGGIIIGADGAVSTVAKHCGMGSLTDYVITYKAEFETTISDTRSVDLFFDKEYRGLFGWLCPNTENILEVGIGINPGKINAKKAFDSFIKGKEIADALGDAKMRNGQASIIPMRLRKRIVDEKHRVILIGDAAGQVKPTTGGGIVFGGNAAIIAAQTIKDHVEKGLALKRYELVYKKRFSTDTKVHSLINKIYSRAGTRGMEIGIGIMNSLGMSSLLGKYGDMDSPIRTLGNTLLRKARG